MFFMFGLNKKGDMNLEALVFILVYVIFFVSLMFFVNAKLSSSYNYEEFYAKEIALIIDYSSQSNYTLDVTKGVELALNENKVSLERLRRDGFVIDNEKNVVRVNLNTQGYFEYPFFVDRNVAIISNLNSEGDSFILINVD